MADGQSAKRYEVLDGMRGVAAICVMLMHTSSRGGIHLFPSASLAVDFFFILSGFVIAHSYGPRTTMGFGEFVCRRMIRLYPMFLFGLIVGGLVLFLYRASGLVDVSNRWVLSSFLFNVFYIPFLNEADFFSGFGDRTHAPIFPANDPSWSLFFEIVANLLFFAVFRAGRRRVGQFVLMAFLAMIGTGILLALSEGRLGWEFQGGWGTLNLVDGLPRVFYGFWMGILVYFLMEDGRVARIMASIVRWKGALYVVFLLMMLMFSLPSLGHLSNFVYLFEIGLLAPVLIYIGAVAPCKSPVALGAFNFLGWLSYPIYCVHFPIMRAVEVLSARGYNLQVPAFFISTTASLLIAVIATKIYDEPLRAWLMRKLKRVAKEQAPLLDGDSAVQSTRS